MKRYGIEMATMQWSLIALDLGRIHPESRSDSTTALMNLIRLTLEHVESPEDVTLPYNVHEVQ